MTIMSVAKCHPPITRLYIDDIASACVISQASHPYESLASLHARSAPTSSSSPTSARTSGSPHRKNALYDSSSYVACIDMMVRAITHGVHIPQWWMERWVDHWHAVHVPMPTWTAAAHCPCLQSSMTFASAQVCHTDANQKLQVALCVLVATVHLRVDWKLT